jgi:hypothetical protein
MSSMPAFWQLSDAPVAHGDGNLFVDLGVVLLGPGSAGPWSAGRDDADFDGSTTRRLATEVRIGDIVLLRNGRSGLVAVGLVASEYLHLPQFEDVNGWDLGQARRVRWTLLPDAYDFGRPVFGGGSRPFGRVTDPDVVAVARQIIAGPLDHWQRAPLPPLPPVEPDLHVVPEAIADLVAHVADLAPVYADPRRFGERPREDEFLVHYVVPLLRCLGWPPEFIAVKWREVDVTLFHRLPRIPEHIALIIEAKRIGEPVEAALGQAQGYARRLQVAVPILVTDGFRYRLYDPQDPSRSAAYANLTHLKRGALGLFARLARAQSS